MIVNIPNVYSTENELKLNSNTNFAKSETLNIFYYYKQAFDSFMKLNEFDYHIRSHNPCEDGYATCFNNRCLTVYSCSKGGDDFVNNISFIMINDSSRKIRFIKFAVSTTTPSTI